MQVAPSRSLGLNTLAIYFRKLNKDTALYLLRIHPQLYFTMTNLLKGRGLTLPNPSQAKWAHFLLKYHKELRAQLAKARNHVEMIPLGGASCYDPPQFFSSLSDPLLVTLSNPLPIAKQPLPLNPSSLPDLPLLPPSEPFKPLSPLDQPPVEPLVPVPWNIYHWEYSSMEMYQEPPLVENPLEDPDSPMEDTPPLEPEPFIPYEPDVPGGNMHALSPEESPSYHGKSTLPQIVLCPANTPCHLQVPHQRPYTNVPVEKAVTTQSRLLPCCP